GGCERGGRAQRERGTIRRRTAGRSRDGRAATVRRWRLLTRSDKGAQRGQAAVGQVEASRATAVLGVRTKSSRRKPAAGGTARDSTWGSIQTKQAGTGKFLFIRGRGLHQGCGRTPIAHRNLCRRARGWPGAGIYESRHPEGREPRAPAAAPGRSNLILVGASRSRAAAATTEDTGQGFDSDRVARHERAGTQRAGAGRLRRR